MKTIAFYANAQKPCAKSVLENLRTIAASLEIETREDGDADVLIALGGDGTFLRAVRAFPETPVLGINIGGLGYLSSVGKDSCRDALVALREGRYTISERRLLEANGKFTALNDIVVTRELTGHAAQLDLSADGKLVTRYMADGLIFATPTGSTAYSLAAGGPVLMPDSRSIVITPMNPHALGIRPLVISDEIRLSATVRPRTDGNQVRVGVYADGENVLTLGEGESVEIATAKKTAKIIELEGYDPYDVLARKLGWSGSNVI